MAAEPEDDGLSAGPRKRARPTLFGHYKKLTDNAQETDSKKQDRVLMQYIEAINNETFIDDGNNPLYTTDTYASLRPLFSSFLRAGYFSPSGTSVFSKWINLEAKPGKNGGLNARVTRVFEMQCGQGHSLVISSEH